jgi:cellulose synthase/poly-beta-1,6-N-acetylglucosamine synthase-like glycosyltransferase
MAALAAVLIVALCFAFVVYVLFGYPLLLGAIAKRSARPVARAPMRESVSFLVAVYNGEAFLEAKLRSILALDYPRELMDILVLSDGSTDRTEEIARRMSVEGVRLLALPHKGKSAALTEGIKAARGEFLVFTDVRQELESQSLALLMENMADPSVGVVSGALTILNPATHEEADTSLYWRYELRIRDHLSRIDSFFGATGAYYIVRRELAVPIPPGSLLDDMYLPLSAFFKGYRLIVDPRARMFDAPAALDAEFRRKVRTLAGNYQILRAYPRLLGPSNRLWFHFWSYKFARLLLPLALILGFAASFALPEPWSLAAVGSQLCFYALAAIDLVIPPGFPVKRLTSPVRTFVTLMGAGIFALSVFFVSPEKIWTPSRAQAKSHGPVVLPDR